jgi:uncharacterized membrane protein YkvA (DUF1232 family)
VKIALSQGLQALRAWARSAKREAIALWFIARDPKTPLAVRLMLWAALAYALSPIDLIPDFIPILGYLDEWLLLPVVIWIALRWVPQPVLEKAREDAATVSRAPRVAAGAVLIGLMWAALLALTIHHFWPVR